MLVDEELESKSEGNGRLLAMLSAGKTGKLLAFSLLTISVAL